MILLLFFFFFSFKKISSSKVSLKVKSSVKDKFH